MSRQVQRIILPDQIKKQATSIKERHLIWAFLDSAGVNKGEIAREFNVRRRTVEYAVKKIINAPPETPLSDLYLHLPVIGPKYIPGRSKARDAIACILSGDPMTMTIDELAQKVEEMGIKASIRTIRRQLKRLERSVTNCSMICRRDSTETKKERKTRCGTRTGESSQTQMEKICRRSERIANYQNNSSGLEDVQMTVLSSIYEVDFSTTIATTTEAVDKTLSLATIKKRMRSAMDTCGDDKDNVLVMENPPINDEDEASWLIERTKRPRST